MSVRQQRTRAIYRWFGCLTAMQTGRRFTVAELAERFGVTPRTVYRDLVALQSMHFPLTNEDGRWYLVEGFRLPPVQFTPDEVAALAAALGWARRTDALRGAAAATALDKVRSVLPDSLKTLVNELEAAVVVDPYPARPVPGPPEVEATLRRAAVRGQKVEIVYDSLSTGQTTRRVIHPYGLAYRGVGLYVIGWCELRQARRTFRVSRIRSVRPLRESFRVPEDFDLNEHLTAVWGIEDGPEMDVVLRFSPAVAQLTRETRWHPTQVTEEQPDGSVILRMKTRGKGELARWLAGFGASVVVVAPAELREAVVEIGRGILTAYEPGGVSESPPGTPAATRRAGSGRRRTAGRS